MDDAAAGLQSGWTVGRYRAGRVIRRLRGSDPPLVHHRRRRMSVSLLVRDVRRRGDVEPVDIAVDAGTIVAVGPTLGLEAATVVPGGGGLALPGLENAQQPLHKAHNA